MLDTNSSVSQSQLYTANDMECQLWYCRMDRARCSKSMCYGIRWKVVMAFGRKGCNSVVRRVMAIWS